MSRIWRNPLKKSLRSQTYWGYVFISPWLFGLAAFTLGPILAMFYYSLTQYSVFEAPYWVGLKNYQEIATRDPLFWKALGNTAFYVGIRVPLHVGLGFTLALLLNQRIRGLALFRTAFYLPTVVPIVATAIVWMWLLNHQVGVAKYLLGEAGIHLPNLFGTQRLVKPTLIGMSLWHVGTIMVVFLAALQDVSQDLYDAASIDGAGSALRLFYITIPMVTPAIFFNLVMDVINSFQVFAAAFIITQGGPLNETLFYVYYIFRKAFEHFEMGYASALAVLLFFIILVFTLALVRSSRSWVHYERV